MHFGVAPIRLLLLESPGQLAALRRRQAAVTPLWTLPMKKPRPRLRPGLFADSYLDLAFYACFIDLVATGLATRPSLIVEILRAWSEDLGLQRLDRIALQLGGDFGNIHIEMSRRERRPVMSGCR
jgi:hypothetical protein